MDFAFVPVTDSTNRHLKLAAEYKLQQNSHLNDFFAICADMQTAGRGQGTHHWHSERGANLLVSFYFQPPIAPNRQFFFNQFFALMVHGLVARYVDDVKIKWPNDIYVGDKKIAGILIEHNLAGNDIRYTIAGLGLNLNQTLFPEDLPNPVSLKILTGKDFDRKRCLEEMIAVGKPYYELLRKNDFAMLKQLYMKHLYRFQEAREYVIQDEAVVASITGVDDYGRLLLQTRSGENLVCGMQEVKFCC